METSDTEEQNYQAESTQTIPGSRLREFLEFADSSWKRKYL